MTRLALRAGRILRQSASTPSSAVPPPPSWPSTRRPPIDPATFPPRTKPRWQTPRGVENVEMPPRFPILAKAQKYGHYLAVAGLVSLTAYTSYYVGYYYYSVRKRRLEWEAANPV